MAASYCLLLWQPVLALHPAPRAAPALGARRTAPPARAVRHDAPRMSTDSNPDSLEDVFEALLKARRGLCLGLGFGLGLPLTTLHDVFEARLKARPPGWIGRVEAPGSRSRGGNRFCICRRHPMHAGEPYGWER